MPLSFSEGRALARALLDHGGHGSARDLARFVLDLPEPLSADPAEGLPTPFDGDPFDQLARVLCSAIGRVAHGPMTVEAARERLAADLRQWWPVPRPEPVPPAPVAESARSGDVLERSTCRHCAGPIALLHVEGGQPIWNHDSGSYRAACSEDVWSRSGRTRGRYLAAGGTFAEPVVLQGLDECRACDGPNGCEEHAEPSDLFADGYSAGRYGLGEGAAEILARLSRLSAADLREWIGGYHRGEAAAEMDSAALGQWHGPRLSDAERFGDHGSPRGPVER